MGFSSTACMISQRLVDTLGPGVAYAAMRTVDQWLEEYGESHRNPANKLLHWICVPIIVVSLVGLLWYLPVPQRCAQYRRC